MKSIIKPLFLSIVLAIMLPVAGQKSVILVPSGSKITISGTSNLHEWEERLEKFEVFLQLLPNGADLTSISKISFTTKSADVVSDNSIMTGKTHDALQVERFPEITFLSSEASFLDIQGNSVKGTVTGDLRIKDVSRRIVLSFTGSISEDRLEVSGTQVLSMSDYNIKPPTALMGTLKTGDKVRVAFLLKFRFE